MDNTIEIKQEIINRLAQEIYPVINEDSSIPTAKLAEVFLSSVRKKCKKLNYPLIAKLIDNYHLVMKDIIDLVRNPQYSTYLKVTTGSLLYRFTFEKVDINRKDNRSSFIIGEFDLEGLYKDGLISSEQATKEIDLTNERHLKYLVPNFGNAYYMTLKKYLLSNSPYSKQLFNKMIIANPLYLLRTCKKEIGDIFDQKIMSALEKASEIYYNQLRTLFKDCVEEAILRSNAENSSKMFYPTGFVAACLNELGLFRPLYRFLKFETSNILLDAVTLTILNDSNIIRSAKETKFRDIKLLSKYIDGHVYGELEKRIDLEITRKLNNGLDPIANFLSLLIKNSSELEDCIENSHIIVDSTSISSNSKQISEVAVGRDNTLGVSKKQVRYTSVYCEELGIPIMGRVDRGKQVDINLGSYIFEDLSKLGYQNLTLVLDRGYYSSAQITKIDELGYNVVIMSNKSGNFTKKLVRENSIFLNDEKGRGVITNSIGDGIAYSKIVEVSKESLTSKQYKEFIDEYGLESSTKDKFYATIFRNVDTSIAVRKLALSDKIEALNNGEIKLDDLKKSDLSRIKVLTNNKGKEYFEFEDYYYDEENFDSQVHVIITSFKPESNRQAIDIYHRRNNIEVQFKELKFLGCNIARVHSTGTLNIKLIITHLAQIVRNYLHKRIRLLSKTKEVPRFKSVNSIFSQVLKMAYSSSTKTKGRVKVVPTISNPDDRDILKTVGMNLEDYNEFIIGLYEQALSTEAVRRALKYSHHIFNN